MVKNGEHPACVRFVNLGVAGAGVLADLNCCVNAWDIDQVGTDRATDWPKSTPWLSHAS